MTGNILNSMKLDYFIIKSADLRRIGIIAIVPLVVGLASKDPLIILGMTMMVSGFFLSSLFALGEKNNLNKLYGVLPVAKRQTVIGRYLFALAAGLVMIALATVETLVVSGILQFTTDSTTFVAWLCGSLLIFGLLVSVQFPLYFKYEFSKMAAFANLPYVLVIIGVVFLTRQYPELFAGGVVFFIHNPYMLWVVGIGGTLVLLAVSSVLSIAFYERREL